MKKQQWILIGTGILLFSILFFFGNQAPPKKSGTTPPMANAPHEHADTLSADKVLEASRKQLSASQQTYLSKLEAAVVRGDIKNQQIKSYKQIAAFWKDSVHLLLPFAYYTGLASKLENSEKSLTFAAHYFLEGLRQQSDEGLKRWMGSEAKSLFEQALTINPNNDSTKVGLGSCYIFAHISENPMQGIQLLREVSERDPENLYAQFMLGLGGMQSGQYAKALPRLEKVVAHQPDNLEALLGLAECQERLGNKKEAVRWYTASKRYFKDQEILKEIDARINLLNK